MGRNESFTTKGTKFTKNGGDVCLQPGRFSAGSAAPSHYGVKHHSRWELPNSCIMPHASRTTHHASFIRVSDWIAIRFSALVPRPSLLLVPARAGARR